MFIYSHIGRKEKLMNTIQTTFLRVNEVAQIMQVSKPKAYAIMRELNKELEARGFLTVSGRINKAYFEQKTGGNNASIQR